MKLIHRLTLSATLAASCAFAEESRLQVTLASPTDKAASTNAPAIAPASATTSSAPLQLDLGLPATTLNRQNELAAQTRLRPPTEAELIKRYGASRYLFKKRSAGSALQLINPLAPAEYGGVGTPAATWSWNPMLAPGQPPLPRAFRDEKTHEAAGWFLNHGF
jgi:hypothetical protein